MNLEEAHQIWDSQTLPPIDPKQLQRDLDRHWHKRARDSRWLLAFGVLSTFTAVGIFYGAHFTQGESILQSSLRALLPLLLLPIQLGVWRAIRREDQERADSQLDQHDNLARMVEDLRKQAWGPSRWQLPAYLTLTVTLVGVVKWMDHTRGADTTAECVGIVVAAALSCLLVGVFAWHHWRMFVVPRYRYFRQLLDSMESLENG